MVTRRFLAAGGAEGFGELLLLLLAAVVVVVVVVVIVGGERLDGWGGMVVVGWERDCRCGGGYESRSSMSSSSSSLTRTKRGDLCLQQVQKVECEERKE